MTHYAQKLKDLQEPEHGASNKMENGLGCGGGGGMRGTFAPFVRPQEKSK